MNLRTLLREALTAARTAPVPSALVLLVVAAMCFAAVATVGRQAATEAAVAAELSGPAARVLTVTDSGGTGFLTGATVATLAGLDSAEAALARDMPVDTVNAAIGAGGTRVAVTHVVGTVDRGVELTRGRLPGPGEVVVPEAKLAELGLAQPSGALESGDGRQWAVVGAFEALTPFEDLADYAIAVPAAPASLVVQQVRVLAPDTAGTRAMQDSALAVIDPDPRSSQVQTARALAAGNATITGELAGLGRSLLLLILGAGAFFVAIVVLADVLIRRRDLGRRRTLGIGRADLVLLVAVRTAAPAVLGAVVGAGTGYAVVVGQGGVLGLDFVAGVAVLAALTAVVASLLPAAFAAFRDPVRVMRTA